MIWGRGASWAPRPFFRAIVLGAALLVAPLPLQAEAARVAEEKAEAAFAIDGDTLALTDGRRVRLDGVNALEIPHRPEDVARCLPSTRIHDSRDFGCDLTLARAAQQELQQLTAGKPVRLLFNPQRREDRYGRLLAQVMAPDKAGHDISVAERLLESGLVHVYPLSGQEIGTAHLLRLEDQARAQKLGIWRLPELQPVSPDEAGSRYGHYAIIEGRVMGMSKTKAMIYIHFGADYRTDFSAQIAKRDWKNFRGVEFSGLQGQWLRLRGYLHEDYGPAMRLTHDGQIEILPPP